MEKSLNNELILIGHVVSGLHKVRVNNQDAVKVILKVKDDNNNDISHNIPVVFINPNYYHLNQCRNKDIAISGHIETRFGMRIIVDAYKSEVDGNIMMCLNLN